MNELALFAGAGGGILGGKLLGWRTVCAVEFAPYPRSVLLARQRDGMLDPFPIWDDVRTFDGHPWRGHVDVVSGGFPCQDISVSGGGLGLAGERSGLWFEMARIIGEVRPRFVFVENSPALVSRGLDRVLGDLACLGFDAEWGVVSAADCGAPHLRKRIWILAHAPGERWSERRTEQPGLKGRSSAVRSGSHLPDTEGQGLPQRLQAGIAAGQGTADRRGPFPGPERCSGTWWATEPDVVRVVHGLPRRVDRIKALGNSQVPAVAALAFRTLMRRLNEAT